SSGIGNGAAGPLRVGVDGLQKRSESLGPTGQTAMSAPLKAAILALVETAGRSASNVCRSRGKASRSAPRPRLDHNSRPGPGFGPHFGRVARSDRAHLWASIEEFFYRDLAGIDGPRYYGTRTMAPGFHRKGESQALAEGAVGRTAGPGHQ